MVNPRLSRRFAHAAATAAEPEELSPLAPLTVHVIGASGRSGAALCRALLAQGGTPVAVVRSAARWVQTGLGGLPRLADLTAPAPLAAVPLAAAPLAAALDDATRIVSCAHARHTPAILAAAPAGARLVLLGSTRKFTRFADAHGDGVLAGEAAFLASGRAGVMLHPTMIYGTQGENNVQRLATLLKRLPIVPLPGGGRALVQPIHQDDVTRCILAALARDWDGPHTITIAGPRALGYANFVRAVALAARLPRPRIVGVPAALLMAAARLLPLPVGAAEIRRLLEDKAFDIGPMQRELGVHPMTLAEGLARTFAAANRKDLLS